MHITYTLGRILVCTMHQFLTTLYKCCQLYLRMWLKAALLDHCTCTLPTTFLPPSLQFASSHDAITHPPIAIACRRYADHCHHHQTPPLRNTLPPFIFMFSFLPWRHRLTPKFKGVVHRCTIKF